MKEQTPPKDPKRKLWAGYGILIALLLLSGTVARLVREFFAGEGKESARAESSN